MNLIIDYPLWFVVLCALVGVAYAMGLYWRDRSFAENSTRYNRILSIFRWATVTIICLLLLDPLMRSTSTERKQPIVVLAQDNSESILSAFSKEQKERYQADFQALEKKLKEKYELKTYSFGDKFRENIDFSYSDKITNISTVFEELYDLYSNQNLTTVIIASDGIYNQGNNPVYSAARLNVPVFAVALGDTVAKKDLVLKKVYNNQIAYLGDKFTIQADVAAINCGGSPSKLQVKKGGAVLYEKMLNVDKNDFFITQEIILEAKQSGIQKFTVEVSPISGETTTANNSKDIYIEVLDARQKILLLAESPHPDLGMMKRVIAANQNYQVEIKYPEELKESVAKYDLVVLHQLPSVRNSISQVLGELNNSKIPHFYVVGTQTNLITFNQSQSLLTINGRGDQINYVEGLLNPNFSTFTLDKKVGENVFKLPPLIAPFGDFNANAKATVLLTQKIGSIDTKYPLWVFGEEKGTKKAVLAAEGIWKWRMADFAQHQNFDIFDELFNKVIVFLSAKEDKRKFRAFASNSIYRENEAVMIDAELYNANYERINEPEARVEITDQNGKKFPFIFNKTTDAYSLKAGIFPAGDYKFEAKTNYSGESLVAAGAFSIQSIQLESFETTADHQLLRNLSAQNGGTLVYPNDLAKLSEMIENKGFAKPILYDTVKTRSLIHEKWIFFLLLLLLSVEWFLRRYWGSY